jgi:hypothetical protein
MRSARVDIELMLLVSAAAIGFGLSGLQQQRFPEKPRRFGLCVVQADADIAQKIGFVSEIRAQLRPEASSLPPRGRQAEDRTEARMNVG